MPIVDTAMAYVRENMPADAGVNVCSTIDEAVKALARALGR